MMWSGREVRVGVGILEYGGGDDQRIERDNSIFVGLAGVSAR
jgi:hypothetical protein